MLIWLKRYFKLTVINYLSLFHLSNNTSRKILNMQSLILSYGFIKQPICNLIYLQVNE